ncbi:MAG: DUF374 domain-containing protein [Nitrospirae bacterium]|nr:DUF374 domain-containing protein [Candidatus Manganitrophaceae bacterium]
MPRTHSEKIVFFLVYFIARTFIQLYRWTCRVKVNGPLLDCLKEEQPVLLTWWHQDMLFNFYFLLSFAKRRKVVTIVSQSKDGALATYLIERCGFTVVRGSSSKGGKAALDRLTEQVVKEKAIGVIVCDGPRPPERVAKPGIVLLAWKSGAPIIKIRSWGTRQYLFRKSWCKLALVLPFSRVTVWSDLPLFIPQGSRGEALERYRCEVEQRLNEMAEISEHQNGDPSL